MAPLRGVAYLMPRCHFIAALIWFLVIKSEYVADAEEEKLSEVCKYVTPRWNSTHGKFPRRVKELLVIVKAVTGGLFIAIVGTFRSKTTCDVLEKLIGIKVS